MVPKFIVYSLLAILLLITGCTTSTIVVDAGEPGSPAVFEEAVTAEPPDEPTYDIRPFSSDSLYNLLVAEFAGLRNDVETSLEIYLQEARKTRDPGVVNRAIRIANFMNRPDSVVEMAELWADIEPENIEARGLAAYSLAREGRVLEAFPHAEYLLFRGDGEYFKSLAAYADNTTEEEQRRLIELFEDLESRSPNHPDLIFAIAMLQRQVGDIDQAIARTRQLQASGQSDESVSLLLAQLLHQSGDKTSALESLEKALEDNPDSKRLRLQYARLLSEKDLKLAREQMVLLVEKFPDDTNLVYSLGLINQEMGFQDDAIRIFTDLVQSNRKTGDAHFQLGRIAEMDGRQDDARRHYLQVRQGDNIAAAGSRLVKLITEREGLEAARLYLSRMRTDHPNLAVEFFQIESELLQKKNQLDSAYQVLSDSLESYPDNISLLYARSVVSAKREDMSATEKDLRAILSLDENNATALNALGYTLLNLSDRYDEAALLLHRANDLNPDDPAITDSLGWLYFRQGAYDKALEYLRRAFAVFPDPEVAAHLGEVLWTVGNRTEAETIWRQALQKDPDSSILLETMRRLLKN